MKNVLRGVLVGASALALGVGFGASASAAVVSPATSPALVGQSDLPDVNVLNNACVAPWYWQGPLNALIESQDGEYAACNGMEAPEGAGINIGENACILPWYWQGPFNIGLGSQDGSYEACNG